MGRSKGREEGREEGSEKERTRKWNGRKWTVNGIEIPHLSYGYYSTQERRREGEAYGRGEDCMSHRTV